MSGKDLCLHLGEVDERFIFEVLDLEEKENNLKAQIMKVKRYSICAAAVLVLAICGNILIYPLINRATKSSGLDSENPRPVLDYEQQMWNEMNMNERYPQFVMEDMVYRASDGNCNEIIGKHIGVFTLVGYERIKEQNKNTVEMGQNEVEKIETEESFVVGFRILGDKESAWKTEEHTTLVNVYEITGINKDFAVGVEFEETGECFVYYNSTYSVETFQQFAQDSFLERYLCINKAYQYQEDTTYCSDTGISTDVIFNVLFSDKTAPMFTSDELLAAFQAGIMKDSSSTLEDNGNATKPYNPNMKDVPPELLFFADKEYGEEVMSFAVDYHLFGQKNVSISLRSGGFVTTNVGITGKCFYVGKEVIEEAYRWLNENVIFTEVTN